MNRREFDVTVVGGGPAGLAAADEAARLGLSTVLLDEQADIGGQIYRSITSSPIQDRGLLGEDYWHGETLAQRFRESGALHFPLIAAKHIILATGAMERPFPFPGWTLPGSVPGVRRAKAALSNERKPHPAAAPRRVSSCGHQISRTGRFTPLTKR